MRNPALLLVGNKTDLEGRQISTRTGQRKADEKGILFAETSAKTTTGIQEAFNALTQKMLDEYIEREPRPDVVKLSNQPSATKKLTDNCGGC